MSNSPPPNTAMGPSPEKIGKSFIKQYYQTLLTNPSLLIRFYQPDSTISRGSAADVASTSGCAAALAEADPGEAVRAQFFGFAGSGGGELSIDFSSGAIDAQESLGGGILLVVTGHVYLPERTGFVHTFFLNNSAPEGRKKVFYVKNDVLRFLGEEKDGAESADAAVVVNGQTQTEREVVEEPDVAAMQEPVVDIPVVEHFVEEVVVDYSAVSAAEEEKIEVIDNLEVEALHVATDEPAAEEEKVDLVEDSAPDSPATSKGSDGKRSKRNRRKKGGKSSRSSSPSNNEVVAGDDSPKEDDTPEKPKTPGSWASLVATGQPKKAGGRRSSPKSRREDNSKSTNTTNHDKAPQDRTPKTEAPTKSAPISSSNTRTPEATLFIRNVPDATKEPEIRSLFETIAASNGNKILGITLNPNKGFCFVDFDSVAAVDAVVAEAEKSLVKEPRTGRKVSSSFMVHGRVLDVERKVKENKGYRGSRGRAGMRRSPPRGR